MNIPKINLGSVKRPISLGVLLSGSGSTLQNIIDHIERGELDARVKLVISSRAGAYGLERAKHHKIDACAIMRKEFSALEEFNRAINDKLNEYELDLLVMAGFMSLFMPDENYKDVIMNIHPALIPSFCGTGWFGHRVHEAVIESGVKVSGCTIHFADDQYDHGPIILQGVVPVLDDDTADTLAERVQAKERELYPIAIQLFAEGRLKIEGRRVRILD